MGLLMIYKPKSMINNHQQIIRSPHANELDKIALLAMRLKSYDCFDYIQVRSCIENASNKKKNHTYHKIYVAENKKHIVGFYVLQEIDSEHAEMTFLYIEPLFAVMGTGKKLFDHAVMQAKNSGHRILVIQSDPYTVSFYQKMGCHEIRKFINGFKKKEELTLLHYKLK